ncbi:MAG: hypothetical protein ACK5PB_23445 [Pirellula sp.]
MKVFPCVERGHITKVEDLNKLLQSLDWILNNFDKRPAFSEKVNSKHVCKKLYLQLQ